MIKSYTIQGWRTLEDQNASKPPAQKEYILARNLDEAIERARSRYSKRGCLAFEATSEDGKENSTACILLGDKS
jgi:hypothetical protein